MAKRKASSGGTAEAVDDRLKLPVEYGGVSIGDGTARLSVVIDRTKIDLETAVATFCGRQLTGCVVVGDGDPDQTTFLDDAEYRVATVFQVKRIGVSPKQYSIGLTFSLDSIDVGDLSHFAKKKGMIRVDISQPLPEKAESNGDESGDDEDGDDDDAEE